MEGIKFQVSEFKGKKYVDIRKFFEKDGQTIPTKKGITIQLDQVPEMITELEKVESGVLAV